MHILSGFVSSHLHLLWYDIIKLNNVNVINDKMETVTMSKHDIHPNNVIFHIFSLLMVVKSPLMAKVPKMVATLKQLINFDWPLCNSLKYCSSGEV